VGEDAGDPAWRGDGRHQAQAPATVRTRQHVEAEGPAQQLGPGDVARANVARLRLVAIIAAPHAIARILAHLGLPPASPPPLPARQPSWLPAD
jgi:hypothetical protein